MAFSETILNTDFAFMISDWGVTVTVEGNAACSAIVDDITESDTLGIEDITESISTTVHVKASDVTTSVPVAGNTVTIGTRLVNIINVVSVLGDTILQLQCQEVTA